MKNMQAIPVEELAALRAERDALREELERVTWELAVEMDEVWRWEHAELETIAHWSAEARRLREALERLVALDEPGSEERRTITLTQITELARAALSPTEEEG